MTVNELTIVVSGSSRTNQVRLKPDTTTPEALNP